MSILEISEQIGFELRKTNEGQHAYKLYNTILEYPQEITSFFFELINKYYVQAHFYSIQHVLNILEANVDNEAFGVIIKRFLEHKDVLTFAKANTPIGNFVEKIVGFVFDRRVKYELPRDITFTPELIRLSNALTVECLRTNVLQRFLREYQIRPEFASAIKRFGELQGNDPIIPYSKEDRKILKQLKGEFGNSCEVELMHVIVTMMTYIKSMIFDAFYGNTFEVIEESDIIARKQKPLNNCVYTRIVFKPNYGLLNSRLGWILKIHNLDGSITYGQIFKKELRWTDKKFTATICAIVFDYL